MAEDRSLRTVLLSDTMDDHDTFADPARTNALKLVRCGTESSSHPGARVAAGATA